MHSVLFGCLTKLRAKHLELVQKFVPGSRVRIFRNECTRSTPLNPKLTSQCVSYYLDLRPFGCLPTLGAKRAELVQKFVPQSCGRIFRNERARSTPLDPKLKIMVRFILWVYLGPFVCLTKLSAKCAELVQKFVPRSRIRIFRNESTRSTL